MGMVLIGLTVPLYTILNVAEANRTFIQYFALQLCRLAWLGTAATLVLICWWAGKPVVLTFRPDALQWKIGNRQRLIAWTTLTGVAASKGGWLPTLIVKHGGAGIILVTPSRVSSRALTRLCLHFLEEAETAN